MKDTKLSERMKEVALPLYLRPVSYILPLTYGADILKSSINNNGHLGLLPNFLILAGFSVLLFAWSIRNVKRKWIY
jgi:ABC-2 type transport system permease protein